MTLVGLDLGNIAVGCWIIGILSAVYVFAGGLKACAWADLLQGSALIAGGAVVMVFALQALGAADPAALVSTAVTPGWTPPNWPTPGPGNASGCSTAGPCPPGSCTWCGPRAIRPSRGRRSSSASGSRTSSTGA